MKQCDLEIHNHGESFVHQSADVVDRGFQSVALQRDVRQLLLHVGLLSERSVDLNTEFSLKGRFSENNSKND